MLSTSCFASDSSSNRSSPLPFRKSINPGLLTCGYFYSSCPYTSGRRMHQFFIRSGLPLRLPRESLRWHLAPRVIKLASSHLFARPSATASTFLHSATDVNVSVGSGKTGIWMFISSLYPISLGRLSLRPGFVGPRPKHLEARIRTMLNLSECPSLSRLEIEQIEPRVKDGGVFIKFSSSAPIQPDLLRSHLLTKLKQTNIKPFWLIGANPAIHLVQGKPWFEDMNMYPNQKILVEFQGPVLPQEELWNLIRPFGRIKEISMPTPKDSIQIAQVTLDSTTSAAIARSCLHDLTRSAAPHGPSTTLKIHYSPPIHAKTVRNWLSSHPRIMLPILAIFLGGISYTLFDPMRQFFIQSNITGTFDIQKNPIFSWLHKETVALLGFARVWGSRTDLPSNAVEKERGDAVRELSSWISGNPESFIVVLGPRGSGKTQVIQSALHERRNSLVINCANLTQDAANDSTAIANLAKSLGYFPQFSFLSSVNNAIDLATTSLLGQKAGFSSTPQDQIARILDTAERAIQSLAREASVNRQLHSRSSSQDENWESEKDGIAHVFQEVIKNITTSNHSAEGSDVPVVVLKNISIKDSARHCVLWECLADWAYRLTEKGIAHVIFTTENSGALKPLAQAFSRRPVKSIVLTDASVDSALQYVFRRLSTDPNRKPMVSLQDSSLIQIVGGRLTDLDALVERIEGGLELASAVEEIVAQSTAEIKRNCFVGDHESGATKELAWKNHQVWDLIKRLSKQDEVPLYPILSEVFSDDFSTLSALEATDLITLSSQENGEVLIKVGKPVYRSAINRLLAQKYFAAANDLNLAKTRLAKAEQSIQHGLSELIEIAKLFPTIHTVGSERGNWLFGSSFSNDKIPNAIKWKLQRILDDLNKSEKIVDLMETNIKQAQLILQNQTKS